MRIIQSIAILFIITGIFGSCQKEYFKKAVIDPNTPISFSQDLQPILTSKCASSGCHDRSVPPNLLDGKAYMSLWDGGHIDTLKPDESILMIKLNTNMPPQKMPASEISKFLIWMKQGAKEN